MILTKKIINFKFSEIFTTKKIINSRILNLLGLQIFRYLLAKIVFFFLKKPPIEDTLNDYNEKGILLIENLLSQNEFLKTKEEFLKIVEKEKKLRDVYAGTSTENTSINYKLYEFEDNEKNKENYPHLYKLLLNKKINNLFKNAEKRESISLFMRLERVITNDRLRNDMNAHWHVDTFHNTHKGWLYLTDIDSNKGPFNYIKGSSKFSIQRLYWEYNNSIKTLFNKNFLSFFVNRNLFNEYEKKKIEIICGENNFLLANTHGYHRRGDAQINQTRDTISFFTRENPYKL